MSLYVITCIDPHFKSSLSKIGISKHPPKRFKSLQAIVPLVLNLVKIWTPEELNFDAETIEMITARDLRLDNPVYGKKEWFSLPAWRVIECAEYFNENYLK